MTGWQGLLNARHRRIPRDTPLSLKKQKIVRNAHNISKSDKKTVGYVASSPGVRRHGVYPRRKTRGLRPG